MVKTFFVVSLLMVSLTACQTNSRNIGAAIGGIALGFLGSQIGSGKGKILTTGSGVLIGTVIGSKVGHSLDDNF
tara:strand:- start:48 stop:269 length:222 start_codon:yes stop_codon:yes gene_type:complete